MAGKCMAVNQISEKNVVENMDLQAGTSYNSVAPPSSVLPKNLFIPKEVKTGPDSYTVKDKAEGTVTTYKLNEDGDYELAHVDKVTEYDKKVGEKKQAEQQLERELLEAGGITIE